MHPTVKNTTFSINFNIIYFCYQDNKEDVILGRMLEVLDEIDVTTIPDYMVTSDIFCLYPLVLLVMNMCEIFTSGH